MRNLASKMIAVLITGSCAYALGAAAQAQLAGITRTDLQRHDLSAAGREVVQARIDIAPGMTSPVHWHPGEEIIYVLEGQLEYKVAGRSPMLLKSGDVLFVPARALHSAHNPGRVKGSELATYVVEKGKPLLVIDVGKR